MRIMKSVQAKCHNYVKRLSKAYPIQSKPNEAPGTNSQIQLQIQIHTPAHTYTHTTTHTHKHTWVCGCKHVNICIEKGAASDCSRAREK